MKVISLDAAGWQTYDDFYWALLPELGAPLWHGHDLNALDDSLFGGMNEVEPPFTVIVTGTTHIPPQLQNYLLQARDVVANAAKEYGHDIALELH